MDEDGYPEESELEAIRSWPHDQKGGFAGLLAYVRERWLYAESGYWSEVVCTEETTGRTGRIYSISTAGWSGNEDLMGAMEANRIFWITCWEESRRGGHYKFNLSGAVLAACQT